MPFWYILKALLYVCMHVYKLMCMCAYNQYELEK